MTASSLTGDLRDKAIVAVTKAIQRVFILLIVAGTLTYRGSGYETTQSIHVKQRC